MRVNLLIERFGFFTINPTFLICQGIWGLCEAPRPEVRGFCLAAVLRGGEQSGQICKKTKEQESLQTPNDVQ